MYKAIPTETGVSVIIPAYNAEAVITRIVRQVLLQTYTDLELLIVDDGSKDRTAEIIDALALEDKRVRVYHQPNGGVSKARNKGIQEAKKKYVTFVDADDEIAPDYLLHMLSVIEQYECDLVISGYKGIPENDILLEDKCYDEKNINDLLLIKNLGITFCKVYVVELLRKHSIEFPVGMKLSEDAVFYYRYLRYVKKVVTVSNQDYRYYQPNGDTKYALSFQDELCGLKAMQSAIIPILQERSWPDKVVERLQQRLLIIFIRVIVSVLAHNRASRGQLFSQIDWDELLPMMKLPYSLRAFVKLRLFSAFSLCLSLYQKVAKKDLFGIFGVTKP